MQEITLSFLRANQAVERIAAFINDEGDDPTPYSIQLLGSGYADRCYSDSDYFHCLRSMRLDLEHDGIRVLCNGARTNAACSGMSSSMGGCWKVYLVEIGRASRLEDLVLKFDPAPADCVGTVEEQDQFQEKWRASFTGSK